MNKFKLMLAQIGSLLNNNKWKSGSSCEERSEPSHRRRHRADAEREWQENHSRFGFPMNRTFNCDISHSSICLYSGLILYESYLFDSHTYFALLSHNSENALIFSRKHAEHNLDITAFCHRTDTRINEKQEWKTRECGARRATHQQWRGIAVTPLMCRLLMRYDNFDVKKKTS